MKSHIRILAAALLFAAGPAFADLTIAPEPVVNNNDGLNKLRSGYASGVWRRGFATPGDAGQPLFFQTSNSACPQNAGAGDGGSCVPSADGKSWRAVFPATGIDVRWFGAKGSGNTADATANATAFQAAANYCIALNAFSGCRIMVPARTFYINSTIALGNVQGTYLVGEGEIASAISAAADVTLISFNGPRSHISDLALNGWGAQNTTQFPGGTVPVISMGSGCTECVVWNSYITGGSNAILAAGTDFVIGYVTALYSYGTSIIDVSGAGYIIRSKIDQPFPISFPAFASVNIATARANTTLYSSVGTIVTSGGYWLQLKTAGTSGGSPPTLKAYEVDIPDGSAVWRLVAPTGMSHLTIENTSSVMNILDSDFTGAGLHAITSSGNSVQVLHSTFGAQMQNGLNIIAGAGFNVSNSQFAAGSGTGSQAAQIASGGTFNGNFQFVDNLVWNYFAGIDLQRSSQHLIAGNQICGMSKTGGVAVHVPAGVSDFVVTGNQLGTCPAWGANYNGIVIDAGASDYYDITHNLTHGVSNAEITDGGTGVHISSPAPHAWTPTITFATSGSVTQTPSDASFTKQGSTVTFHGTVTVSGLSSPVGGASLSLPTAIASGAKIDAQCSFYSGMTGITNGPINMNGTGSPAQLFMANGTGTGMTSVLGSNFTASSTLQCGGSYQAPGTNN